MLMPPIWNDISANWISGYAWQLDNGFLVFLPMWQLSQISKPKLSNFKRG
jgi:hypothetical protein